MARRPLHLYHIALEKISQALNNTCFGCFNNPCTCENKAEEVVLKGQYANPFPDADILPYNIKREKNVKVEKRNDKNKEGSSKRFGQGGA